MVRSVSYRPTKAFALPTEQVAKYREIAAKIKEGTAAASASSTSIEAALGTVVEYESKVWDPTTDDAIDEKDSEFVGITLDGSMLTIGELVADTSDVFLEEPRVVEEQEEEDENDRDLWCDGDKNPEEDDDA